MSRILTLLLCLSLVGDPTWASILLTQGGGRPAIQKGNFENQAVTPALTWVHGRSITGGTWLWLLRGINKPLMRIGIQPMSQRTYSLKVSWWLEHLILATGWYALTGSLSPVGHEGTLWLIFLILDLPGVFRKSNQQALPHILSFLSAFCIYIINGHFLYVGPLEPAAMVVHYAFNRLAAMVQKKLERNDFLFQLHHAGFPDIESVRISQNALRGETRHGIGLRRLYSSEQERELSSEEIKNQTLLALLSNDYSTQPGWEEAFIEAAESMLPHIKTGSLLIPIPSRNAESGANYKLASVIENLAPEKQLRVLPALKRDSDSDWKMGLALEEDILKQSLADVQGEIIFIDHWMTTGEVFTEANYVFGGEGKGLAFAYSPLLIHEARLNALSKDVLRILEQDNLPVPSPSPFQRIFNNRRFRVWTFIIGLYFFVLPDFF
jgi:hypothetical protein